MTKNAVRFTDVPFYSISFYLFVLTLAMNLKDTDYKIIKVIELF